jgi:hypothetical protein
MPSISKISIEQQRAEIGLHSIPAQMNIHQPRMRMKIHSELPQMEIDRKDPSFKVNRKRINTESGLKPPDELTKTFRDRGRAGALRGARTAKNDGNFLGDLRQPGDRVGRLARNKTMSAILAKRDYNIGLMPASPPEVDWDRGHMRINWSKHSIVIDWDGEFMPQVTIDPKYSVEIFLRTEPYFRITVEEVMDAAKTGKYVDRAV